MSERISEAFLAIIDWATSLGAKHIKDLPGCWEHDLGDQWWIAINGHSVRTDCSHGPIVEPFSAYVEFNGLPCASIGYQEGGIIGSDDMEDRLIDALRKATPCPAK